MTSVIGEQGGQYNVNQSDEVTLVGQSPAVEEERVFAHFAARSEFRKYTVLLLGESGVGKGHLALLMHSQGGASRPFITVNCPSLPESLVESELFGHTKGAFTGAQSLKSGQIEEARGGTLFLDEIGGLSLSMQAKLLRFVETKRFRMIGENKERVVDTRIIAATNLDPEKAIKEGGLLEDLFHRLDRLTFTVQPLRNRKEDIQPLALHILKQEGISVKLLEEALVVLSGYHWPGNVRELENVVIKSALAFFLNPRDKGGIGREHVEPYLRQVRATTQDNVGDKEIEFRQALIKTRGDISRASSLVGISRTHGYRRVRNWKLDELVKSLRES